jgi:para-aminobenzoate synthetase/4-amino-4-deoxychorismate lyase
MAVSARLDDLRPSRQRSAVFTDQVGEIAATTIDDVLPAMERAEEAAAGGLWAVGYVAYEAAPAFDPNLTVADRSAARYHPSLPLLWFGLYRRRVIDPRPPQREGDYALSAWRSTVDEADFVDAVDRIRDRIIAGDTYQVNYTARLRAHFTGNPFALYHDLVTAQSGGYGAYLDTGPFRILSASPELFFDRLAGPGETDRIVTRPMKGTAERGRWLGEDEARREALESSEKDRAENLIIVDLLRNDLGRIAEFGTVFVEDLLTAERYDTVWQLTSKIAAEVDPDLGLVEVFRALFPCGSITGAPKVRTMEIITATESEPRGVYTGAIGFISPTGAPGPKASFSVGIRTVVVETATGDAEYGIGGGITYDSVPTAEYREARLKAKVLTYGRSDFRLLETVRWDSDHGWYWLDRHLDRLEDSAAYFAVPIDRAAVLTEMEALTGRDDPLRVRLTVDRRGTVDVEKQVLEDDPGPVKLALDDDPVDTASPFLFHKTTRRALYEDRSRRHPDADDVLLVNGKGEITESTVANVVVRLDGRWVTPPVESGCLPGVYRSVLLGVGRIHERVVTLDDLRGADEVALINSVRLWRPALLIG